MRKQIKYATVCGMTFAGDTVAIAKANGEQEITRLAHEANIGPGYYKVGKLSVIVFPQLEGWAYRIILDTDKCGPVQPMCQMGGTRAQCIASAISHAAMWQWSIDDATNADDTHLIDHNYLVSCFWPARKDASPDLGSELDRRSEDCAHQMKWQRRYRALAQRGVADTAAHDIASKTRTIAEAIAHAD
jgi:hypothetical protein